MWTEVIFIVGRSRVEAWSDALLDSGAAAVQIEDADSGSPDEEALFGEPGEPPPPAGWQRTRIAALIDDRVDPPRLLARAAALCGDPVPERHEVRALPEQDWVRATQAQFEPIPIGERLLITPSWHLPHDGAALADHRLAIILDPGLAFGTGSHPTTRMCLQWLDACLPAGASVIDYGCGSGILAIAAARLGATPVVAVDIDPQALESTRTNARVNNVAITICRSSDPVPQPADVVLANILANPLRVLAPMLASLVRPGGQLVLGGLLERQTAAISACYPRFELRPWRSEDGWACLAGRARS